MLITEKGILDTTGNHIGPASLDGRRITAGDSRFGRTAVVADGAEVWETHGDGWRRTAVSEETVNCLIWLDDSRLLAGCADARAGIVDAANGVIANIEGFDSIPERSEWNTPWGGPPDVRSFAIASDGTVYANIHVGWIAKSADSGSTWESVRTGLEKDVHQVVVHPDSPDVVMAATARGFHLSDNRGETFERKSEPMPYYYQRACAVFPGTDTYLCTTSRGPHGNADALLFRSEDGGNTWKLVEGLPEKIAKNLDTFQLTAQGDGKAYLVVDNTNLYLSTDFGVSWNRIAENLPKVYGLLTQDS